MMRSWQFSSVNGIIELFWGDIPPFLLSGINNKKRKAASVIHRCNLSVWIGGGEYGFTLHPLLSLLLRQAPQSR